MFWKKNLVLAALTCLSLSSAAHAGWLYSANSVVRAEEDTQKHPKVLVQTTVAARAAEKPFLCVSYHNTVSQSSKGRVVAKATVLNSDGSTESIRFAGGVKKNSYLKCKEGPSLEQGAAVLWNYDFKGMPRLRNKDGAGEIAEVSGIISTAGEPELGRELPLGLVLPEGLEPLGLVPGKKGGWFHSTESIFQASKNNEKHPAKLSQILVVPADAKGPKVCISYTNVAKEKNKGRVVTTVTINRSNGNDQTLKFAGGVKSNDYLKCKKANKVVEGDLVFFDFELKGMPRLKMGADGGESVEIHGVLTASGDPIFREPPPPPPPPPPPTPAAVDPPPAPTQPAAPPPPSTPAPPPPSGGGGAISFADEQAVHKLLKSSTRGTQLWRAKGNSPGKWVVVGPKTKVISGNNLDYSTAGVGGTIAGAVANYESKTNSNLGAGAGLSSTEKSLIQWYSGINAAGGPTSVRFDGQGRYHGEYYRPSKGARTKTVTSLSAALDWLQDEGL